MAILKAFLQVTTATEANFSAPTLPRSHPQHHQADVCFIQGYHPEQILDSKPIYTAPISSFPYFKHTLALLARQWPWFFEHQEIWN